ncbi:flagellin N-terminal helical domain-containing protein, partial [Escherichia coli]|uniref:flagellin N-terminal helical domain-containing protein n=1 Tax=Escherichia coli TaxID=562 RepID=UPI003F7A7D84
NLNKSQSALGTAIERLSSGLRINSAKDDAAGMAIANRFTANVKGLTQAARNANDGISLAQTTEGAAAEINTHLQRVRELAVQAGNSSYSQEQRNSMQDEINQRLSDIDRISEQTDFNGVKVLSAKAEPLTLQVGANDGETINLNLSEISIKTLGLDGFNVNGSGVTQNRSATVSDLQAAGGTTVAANEWQV